MSGQWRCGAFYPINPRNLLDSCKAMRCGYKRSHQRKTALAGGFRFALPVKERNELRNTQRDA